VCERVYSATRRQRNVTISFIFANVGNIISMIGLVHPNHQGALLADEFDKNHSKTDPVH
jgi:hypothetical protein